MVPMIKIIAIISDPALYYGNGVDPFWGTEKVAQWNRILAWAVFLCISNSQLVTLGIVVIIFA